MIPASHVRVTCGMLNSSIMERSHRETLILGVGNPLRRDDGIGPAVIQLLENERVGYKLSDAIDLVDGRTDGLGLIEYLKNYKK